MTTIYKIRLTLAAVAHFLQSDAGGESTYKLLMKLIFRHCDSLLPTVDQFPSDCDVPSLVSLPNYVTLSQFADLTHPNELNLENRGELSHGSSRLKRRGNSN